MKKLFTILFAALAVVNADASNITNQLADSFGHTNTVSVTFKKKSVQIVSGKLVYTSVQQFTATNGLLSVSNAAGTGMSAGNYDVMIGPRNDMFPISVPDDTNTYSLGMLITNGLTFTYQYSPQYLSKTGDNMTGNLGFNSTNYAGLILNRLTTTQRNNLTLTNGMIVYDTTLNQPMMAVNGAWVNAVVSGPGVSTNYGGVVWLLNTTNQFAGTFTGSGAGLTGYDATNLTDLANFVQLSTIKTNRSFVSATLNGIVHNPPAIFTPAATISGTINGNILTTSSPVFDGNSIGYDIAIGTDQRRIWQYIDSTHVWVTPRNGATFSGSNFTVYPASRLNDINGNKNGWIGNDCSLGIIGQLNGGNNSGEFDWGNGSNSFRAIVANQVDGNRWELQPVQQNGGAPFSVHELAPYNSLRVMNGGLVSFRFGITNGDGASIPFLVPISLGKGLSVTNTLGVTGTTLSTNGSTITLVNQNATITGTSGAFTGAGVGWIVDTTPNPSYVGTYVITRLNSATSAQVYPAPIGSSSGVNFYLHPPMQTNTSTGGGVSSGIDSFGNLFLDGLNASPAVGLLLAAGTNSLKTIFVNDGAGPHWAFENPIGKDIFQIGTMADYDSLRILNNSYVSVRFGLTNGNGGTILVKGGLTVDNSGGATFSLAPTFSATNATPGGFTVGSTSPRIWLPFTNGATVFYLPGY